MHIDAEPMTVGTEGVRPSLRRTELARHDGVTVSYAVSGEGPAVICIQGVGVAGRGWDPQLATLSSRFRCVAFDHRGIGSSARGRGALTIETMADDVRAILDAEGIERCHLVGHSMGGLVALDTALAAPARIASLSLLCTFADGGVPTRASLRMALLGLGTRVGTASMRRQAMLRLLFPARWLRDVDRVALAARLEELFARDLADTPLIVREQLRAMSRYDARGRLGELAGIPALVVNGRHDPIAPPAFGRLLAAAIPGARYVEFDDASHALPVQCAGTLNVLLLEHLTASAS